MTSHPGPDWSTGKRLADDAPLALHAAALTRELIRNACVNDGSVGSGHEHRSVASLERFFHGSGLEWQVVEPQPGRTSLVASFGPADAGAPSLLLLGHLDVVPADAGWSVDPFEGLIRGDELWGRGALDMLHMTATYATVIRALARERTPLRGRVVFAAVADEESGGRWGTQWLLENRPELLDVDAVLSETGGIPLGPGGQVNGVTVTVGEKGLAARRISVSGRPRHAATPHNAENAVLAAAEVVRRIHDHPPQVVVDDLWPRYVGALGLEPALELALSQASTIDAALPHLGPLAGLAHALTRTTYALTAVHAGEQVNVIPGRATIDVDVRTMPGTRGADVERELWNAVGDLADRVEIEPLGEHAASTRSPLETPLFGALDAAVSAAYPNARAVPVIAPGGADSRFFRSRGIPAYGFGMFSDRWDHATFRTLVHGADERIDLESIRLSVEALERVVRRFAS